MAVITYKNDDNATVDKDIKMITICHGSRFISEDVLTVWAPLVHFLPQRLESLCELYEFVMQAGMMQIPQIHSLMELELIAEWRVLQVDL